ncbi:MAG TPA: MbtH family NRPS accessory protein, partial [Pyrinomonadaceae bacterium]
GSVGLATSGSGDVLAGVIAGLVARGAEPLRAAAWGVYLHARAGERLSARLGTLGLLARELPGEIPPVMSELSNHERRARRVSREEREDNTVYKVVVNHEEQYSIWPADRENALGWNDAGKQGTRAECLAYIDEVWTDMRQLSLRKKMEEGGR